MAPAARLREHDSRCAGHTVQPFSGQAQSPGRDKTMAECGEAHRQTYIRTLDSHMRRKLGFASLLLFISLPAIAQVVPPDAPWTSKRIPEWNDKDAFLIL